ncbi:hypothetical protein BDV93DRAFT_520086 [Ceratobasidium sp. AG-I]|nr:hypothetical protein BDV93DRAFT_520086 [Ceratobasidium sp. AG-I]
MLIDQDSMRRFINTVSPGSYKSVSKIDFKALDGLTIKPMGLYGCKSEIIKFLRDAQCLNKESETLLSSSEFDQRSGLYLVLPSGNEIQVSHVHHAYLVYWPEESTWDDKAISSIRRNRVTFMRYLSKLTDQTLALVSTEQASLMVWETGGHNADAPVGFAESNEEFRMFSFEVSQTSEQEEDAIASSGFEVTARAPEILIGAESHISLVSGEEKAGLLVCAPEPARQILEYYDECYTSIALRAHIRSKISLIVLGNLSADGLLILGEHGLSEIYPQPFADYRKQVELEKQIRDQSHPDEAKLVEEKIKGDTPKLGRLASHIFRSVCRDIYPSLGISTEVKGLDSEEIEPLLEQYRAFDHLADKIKKNPDLTIINDQTFKDLKQAWSIIRQFLTTDPIPSIDRQAEFIQETLGVPDDGGEWQVVTRRNRNAPGWFQSKIQSAKSYLVGGSASGHTLLQSGRSDDLTDQGFVASLPLLASAYPALGELALRINACLKGYLHNTAKKTSKALVEKIITDETTRRVQVYSDRRSERYDSGLRAAALDLSNRLKTMMPSRTSDALCVDFVEPAQAGRYSAPKYRVRGRIFRELKPQIRSRIYPFELTEHDIQQCRSNELYMPKPKFGTRQYFEFALKDGHTIEFLQLVGDKCLVVIAEPNAFRLYIENDIHLPAAIKKGIGRREFKYERVGKKCVFAFDQSTRLFAIFHGIEEPKLSVYAFDESFSDIRGRGSPLALKSWYDTEVHVEKICFVSGSEEICIIEKSGQARIFSLIAQQFRPATLQINGHIVDAFSTPDGSCLLVSVNDETDRSHQGLLAFHWTSFGSNQDGIEPGALPLSDSDRVITSFEGRNRIHLLSLEGRTITSTALQIKQKTTEFSFRSKQKRASRARLDTTNNSLIDCHLEVWTRFPVVPAVSRTTLSPLGRKPRMLAFVSSTKMEPLEEYFRRMVSKFERTTRKPMDEALSRVCTLANSSLSDVSIGRICSKYALSSFIVELLCLIPIHLAITRDNRFLPLKDGVWDPKHERSLLGADLPAIVDTLSIGWYESLFQSYMATKPVRVVSSMGEQSVGKSYCLNHFADTSFAGSAMRTTEGVWLSCTPTDEYLLVSLDFEGVHSIERSAQEDSLLVLFNAAISNLVLFRNNFALSRDIADLFTSFQSSAMVLDPRANPGLFNSTLAIIIKDVTDSDSKDIVKEFSIKFQRIVQKEQDQNFISRLHRGQIQIIPWPVINSSGFYALFRHLHSYLDQQPVTHPSGGVFLLNLKTLMAKIKTSDWGSLDQNLATLRALQLTERMQVALCRGRTEQGIDSWGPLKNLDTDEDLPSMELDAIFFVPDLAGGNVADENANEKSLKALIRSCESSLGSRHGLGDAVYFALLQNHLFDQLDRRLEHVRHWIRLNTERFAQENQDIRGVHIKLNNAALTMRAAVRLCSITCSLCHFRCVRTYRHSDAHDCGTTHHCESSCELAEEHPDPVPCGLPAGHGARHMCDVKAHSCGNECHLSGKSGCARVCVKPLDHDGDHMCSARSHRCGQPCSLRDINNGYSCPGICYIDWDEPHIRHSCSNGKSCPIECQLCRRLCYEPDHFHGLEVDAIHLCGQKHDCTSPCAANGICRIETQPSAVKEQFSGRHEAFEYTKFSQVEQRLTCVVPIPAGELYHQGAHTHSADKDVFHFCDARCPDCQYLCTLPLGHPQRLHETSHGSMTTTQWAVEGADQNAVYELQGRKFGSGDEGGPMLCHLLCADQGRHAHIDYCRDVDNCGGPECEHISERMHPDVDQAKDWISHRLKWARSGFQDPYSREQQLEFSKCDVMCAGPEHEASATSAAHPSYCKLPIFHPPQPQNPPPPAGYVSIDGHLFNCQNPARMHQAYHIVFVIDNSGSMAGQDKTPLPNTPISIRLRSSCNNRYGAVLSALHSFWISRESANARQDAYSVITFNTTPVTQVSNDFASSTDQLIERLIPHRPRGGTNFSAALAHAQTLIRSNWSSDRAPVLVFLSDGQCTLGSNPVYDICRLCVQLGKPLAFYTVSFGSDIHSASLRQMVNIAREVYASAPQDALGPARGNPCSYTNAIDTIQLADTFLGIANSLQKPRASLIGQQSSGRRANYQ